MKDPGGMLLALLLLLAGIYLMSRGAQERSALALELAERKAEVAALQARARERAIEHAAELRLRDELRQAAIERQEQTQRNLDHAQRTIAAWKRDGGADLDACLARALPVGLFVAPAAGGDGGVPETGPPPGAR